MLLGKYYTTVNMFFCILFFNEPLDKTKILGLNG